MRKIMIEKTVYNYDELSNTAKEKVKEIFLEWYHDTDTFSDYISECLKNTFPTSDLKCEYSLSSCQGDGVNIYGDMSIKDAVDYVLEKETENYTADEIRFLKFMSMEGFTLHFKSNNYYTYYLDKRNDIEYYCIDNFEMQYFRKIPEALINKFANSLNNLLETMCKDWEKYGYEFFYEMDEDEIKDIIDCNEYEFNKDGTIF